MIDALSRRSFIGMSLAVTTAAMAAGAPGLADASKRRVTGWDSRLSANDREIARSQASSEVVELPVEIVGAWRSHLREQLASALQLDAYTRWDLALVLTGLAREERFAIEQHQLSPSLFLTRIAAR